MSDSFVLTTECVWCKAPRQALALFRQNFSSANITLCCQAYHGDTSALVEAIVKVSTMRVHCDSCKDTGKQLTQEGKDFLACLQAQQDAEKVL